MKAPRVRAAGSDSNHSDHPQERGPPDPSQQALHISISLGGSWGPICSLEHTLETHGNAKSLSQGNGHLVCEALNCVFKG